MMTLNRLQALKSTPTASSSLLSLSSSILSLHHNPLLFIYNSNNQHHHSYRHVGYCTGLSKSEVEIITTTTQPKIFIKRQEEEFLPNERLTQNYRSSMVGHSTKKDQIGLEVIQKQNDISYKHHLTFMAKETQYENFIKLNMEDAKKYLSIIKQSESINSFFDLFKEKDLQYQLFMFYYFLQELSKEGFENSHNIFIERLYSKLMQLSSPDIDLMLVTTINMLRYMMQYPPSFALPLAKKIDQTYGAQLKSSIIYYEKMMEFCAEGNYFNYLEELIKELNETPLKFTDKTLCYMLGYYTNSANFDRCISIIGKMLGPVDKEFTRFVNKIYEHHSSVEQMVEMIDRILDPNINKARFFLDIPEFKNLLSIVLQIDTSLISRTFSRYKKDLPTINSFFWAMVEIGYGHVAIPYFYRIIESTPLDIGATESHEHYLRYLSATNNEEMIDRWVDDYFINITDILSPRCYILIVQHYSRRNFSKKVNTLCQTVIRKFVNTTNSAVIMFYLHRRGDPLNLIPRFFRMLGDAQHLPKKEMILGKLIELYLTYGDPLNAVQAFKRRRDECFSYPTLFIVSRFIAYYRMNNQPEQELKWKKLGERYKIKVEEDTIRETMIYLQSEKSYNVLQKIDDFLVLPNLEPQSQAIDQDQILNDMKLLN